MRKWRDRDSTGRMLHRSEPHGVCCCAIEVIRKKRDHNLSQKSVNCKEKIPDQDKTDKSEVNIQYLDSVIVTEDGLCRLHHMLAGSALIASKYLI